MASLRHTNQIRKDGKFNTLAVSPGPIVVGGGKPPTGKKGDRGGSVVSVKGKDKTVCSVEALDDELFTTCTHVVKEESHLAFPPGELSSNLSKTTGS